MSGAGAENLDVRRPRKSYGGVERLYRISFSVERGEIFGFLGTNGAGKTTTIEILEGYRARDGGEVSVLGTDPARAERDWRNRIGLVLQESELNPVYTVRETVAMFSRYFRRPTDLDATITSAGLTDKAGERVGRLSGGERRRVDVAIGLVGDPDVLFLDEPITGLYPAARRSRHGRAPRPRPGQASRRTGHHLTRIHATCPKAAAGSWDPAGNYPRVTADPFRAPAVYAGEAPDDPTSRFRPGRNRGAPNQRSRRSATATAAKAPAGAPGAAAVATAQTMAGAAGTPAAAGTAAPARTRATARARTAA